MSLFEDPRVARRARQIGMAQQNLDDPDIGAVLQKMRGEAVPQRMDRDPLGEARRGTGRTAGRMQHLDVERLRLVAAGEQPMLRTRQTPIGSQNGEQLRRQHDGAVLAALALLDPDDHPATVDIANLEAHRLGGAQSGGVGRGQCAPRLQARHRLEKAHHFVGVQHHRQLVRFPSIGDPLRDRVEPQRHAVEEPQRADRLVQRRPRDALCHQLDLEGADVLKAETVRRATEMATELRNCVDVGSLGRRRQIADRHVLDHATTQRAQLGHLKLLSERWAATPTIISDRRPPHDRTGSPAQAGSFNPLSEGTL
ncbi:MAG: hypothetical protein NVSMB26_28110 [Beijerinckiaceae bacterium]